MRTHTSHSGIPMKWQAWKAATAWGRAEGSARPEQEDNTQSQPQPGAACCLQLPFI